MQGANRRTKTAGMVAATASPSKVNVVMVAGRTEFGIRYRDSTDVGIILPAHGHGSNTTR